MGLAAGLAAVIRHGAAGSGASSALDAMTRSDLVAKLAERFPQLTQRDTEFVVKTILDDVRRALARGHRIEIRGSAARSAGRRGPLTRAAASR